MVISCQGTCSLLILESSSSLTVRDHRIVAFADFPVV
jgi:hypothetical protein